MGIPRRAYGAGAALRPHPASDAHGRTAGGAFRPHLLLQRGGHPVVPCAGERGHDRGADARHGHSAALHELWGLVAHRVHHPGIHRRAARRRDAAVLARRKILIGYGIK